jgi:hypothetical protein
VPASWPIAMLVKVVSFGIEDSVAHAANLRRGIYVGKLQPAWRPFCRFLAVSG